jgi:hypothetical protein
MVIVGGGGGEGRTGSGGRVRVVVGEGAGGDLISNTYIVIQAHKTYPDGVHD